MTTIDHPDSFKEGVRILMLTLRGKDGGSNKPDRKAHTIITRNRTEFDTAFLALRDKAESLERIYVTVDERDFNKAMMLFKHRQLEADCYDQKSKEEFYMDLKNRFVSCLQNPSCRVGTLFMVDIDDEKNELEPIMREIKEKNIEIVHQYPTKNGVHLILNPFNPALVSFTVLKNHMLLLAY